jgi:hypothetical protein
MGVALKAPVLDVPVATQNGATQAPRLAPERQRVVPRSVLPPPDALAKLWRWGSELEPGTDRAFEFSRLRTKLPLGPTVQDTYT